MSIDRSRRDPEGATGLAAIEMAVVALLVVAVAATGLLAPRLVRALGDHAALRDRHAAALERVGEARAATDPAALARLAEDAQTALTASASAYPTAEEREAALADMDAAARAADVRLQWEAIEAPGEAAPPPCVAQRYRLVAEGEFLALLGFLTAAAEDLPLPFVLDGLVLEAEASAPQTGLSTLEVVLTTYSVAAADEPAPLRPRTVQGAHAGQE